MPGAPDPLYIAARRTLFDALEAMEAQLDHILTLVPEAPLVATWGSLIKGIGLAALVTACTGDSSSPGPSTGLEREWALLAEPLLELGVDETRDGHLLFRVVDAELRGDGSVIVANAGSSDVRVFDAGGNLLWRVGAPGQGPGDFGFIRGVAQCGDSIAVFEDARLTLLSARGDIGRIVSAPSGESPPPAPVDVHGTSCLRTLWLTRRQLDPQADGLLEQEYVLNWHHARAPGKLEAATFVGTRRYRTTVDGAPAMVRIPWLAEASWTTLGDALVVAEGSQAALRVWDNTERTISWSSEDQAVTPEEEDLYRTSRRLLVEEEPRYARSLLPFEDIPGRPTVRPDVHRILADPTGLLWVQPYRTPTDGIGGEVAAKGADARWTIVDVSGRIVATVRIPSEFEPTHVGREAVAGVWTDDVGLETVQVRRLIRSTVDHE